MKFQKTGQTSDSGKNRSITETSALPILSAEDCKSNSVSSISSSTPDTIDFKALKELAHSAAEQGSWSRVEIDEVDSLFTVIKKHLDKGSLKKVELPLLKLLKLIATFETDSHELTWEVCEILAKIYGRQNSNEKCLTMLSQSLTLKQAVLGETHPSYILTLVENANCLKLMGQTEDANELYKKARELKTQ